MFDVISKREFWSWHDAGLAETNRIDLKGIQDAYIASRLDDVRGARILEIGGGNSRVLSVLSEPPRGNECWNAERFEGVGGGPLANENDASRIKLASCFVGEFSSELPDGYFDYVISVSVVEHVATADLEAFFADSARVLRPGGQILHAIDVYLLDHDADLARAEAQRGRIRSYLSFGNRRDLGICFTEAPAIDESVSFRCSYATNADIAMNQWNRLVPDLRPLREIAQSVSLKAEWTRR